MDIRLFDRRRLRKAALFLALLFTVLLFRPDAAVPENSVDPGHVAAGYKAGFTCSGVFIADRGLADIKSEELRGGDPTVFLVPEARIDHESRAVRVPYSLFMPPRLAVYHDGFGCVLLPPGSTMEDKDMLPEVNIPEQGGEPSEIAWPDGDLTRETAFPQEVNRAKLDKAVEEAFTGLKYKPHQTLGVVVVYRGRIIAERYAEGWGMHTQYRTWSTAKSITNAMVGIMVKKGKLDVKQKAPIPEWKDDPRQEITIENLLHMSSGLKSKGALTREAYWGGINTARAIVKSKLEAEPGTRWKYSNFDTLLLMLSIKNVLANNEKFWKLPHKELFNKIGMRDTYAEIDPYGNYILSSQVYTTPRDLARFGLLYLNNGVWNGERILPKGWVEYTVQPAPAKEDKGYGAQFWLIGTDPRIPDDAFTTSGARGQLATVVPSRDLVVVRTGLDPLVGSSWSQEEFVKDIIKAIEG
ncbi:MAG: serine hydrolase [bacterium]